MSLDSEVGHILDPEVARQEYVAPLLELRKHKGLTALTAEDHLQDNVVLGTMMLQMDNNYKDRGLGVSNLATVCTFWLSAF